MSAKSLKYTPEQILKYRKLEYSSMWRATLRTGLYIIHTHLKSRTNLLQPSNGYKRNINKVL